MDFYSMEQFEIMGDAMEELKDWEEFEDDFHQYLSEIPLPTDEDIEEMAKWFW